MYIIVHYKNYTLIYNRWFLEEKDYIFLVMNVSEYYF